MAVYKDGGTFAPVFPFCKLIVVGNETRLNEFVNGKETDRYIPFPDTTLIKCVFTFITTAKIDNPNYTDPKEIHHIYYKKSKDAKDNILDADNETHEKTIKERLKIIPGSNFSLNVIYGVDNVLIVEMFSTSKQRKEIVIDNSNGFLIPKTK